MKATLKISLLMLACSLPGSPLCPAQMCAAQNTQNAQNADNTLAFDSQTWDFGTINEVDGPVSHLFTFTNTSALPIIIERVNSDCGCTVPKYSSEPVRPGRTGTIEVAFDPTGYSGRFTKSVSVFCNNGKSRNALTLTGIVIGRERGVEDVYPYLLGGGVRTDNLRAIFDYVEQGSANSMVIGIVNTSDRRVSLKTEVAESSGVLKIHAPDALAPGERNSITFTYDLSDGRPVYGALTDNVYIAINGTRSNLSLSAHAVAIDDFGNIDPAKTPGCYIEPMYYNFGKAAPGQALTREMTLSNTGTAPLAIRRITPRNDTATEITEGMVVEPGATIRFGVTFTAKSTPGVSTGGFTIISNDPERPVRDVRLAVEVIE